MLCVKKDIVKMDWEAEGFLENRYCGFIAACHNYHGVIVAFEDSVAYAMIDSEGSLNMTDVVKCIKDSYNIKKGSTPSVTREYDMDEYEEYTLLVSGVDVIEDNVTLAGLTQEDVEDILKRMEDLEPYFREVVVDDL